VKASIVIPSYNHCEDLLKPCLESINRYTDLRDTEVIVVANGCTDGTREYVESLGPAFRLLWLPDPSGYTKSTNLGIRESRGEYVVLLNNDTFIQESPKNYWLDQLINPFMGNPKMGITGPMKTYCPEARREFLIGFCVCTPRKLLHQFGLLDEIFSPGYGEDTDYCCKLEDAGFTVHSICPEAVFTGPNRMSGNFPMYHAGNVTFKNWVGGERLLAHNNEILRQRYAEGQPLIWPALACDGFINTKELIWLGREAAKHSVIVEIGSWHGRSARALADNCRGRVYCVDTWNGSQVEQATNHASAKLRDGDHAFYEFLQNNWDKVQSGRLVPLRMSSKNASEFFKEKGIKADMVFIDAGHEYEEVRDDIDAWKAVVSDGGLFCGHDITAWHGVGLAVAEKLSPFYVGEGTTIWHCPTTSILPDNPRVFDCFPFNNELDILERRLTELSPVVDRFVIVEALKTHGGGPKPLNFHNNLGRFSPWLHKITYIVVEDSPDGDSWAIERHQRDGILRGLRDCKPNDIIMISDCDEIPSADAVRGYKPEDGLKAFRMELYYYNENTKAVDPWTEAKILPFSLLQKLTPCGARYTKAPEIENGGKHLSYFGDVEAIIRKLKNTAHQEYNTDFHRDPERIRKAIKDGTDLFGRDLKFERV
jgi:beta-1,4-mannosyl-glycoprotein beta-1,4-N-acetylglucosaminyltransferase